MALIAFGGFEDGGVGDFTANGITGTASVQSSVKKNGTYAFRSNPTTTAVGHGRISSWAATTGLPASMAAATIRVGLWFRVDTLPASGDEPIVGFSSNTTSTDKGEVRINSSGQLAAYDATGTIMATGATVLSTATWYWLGFKWGKSATVAVWEVQINGVSEISGTANLVNANTTQVFLGKSTDRNGKTVDFYYDGWAIDDAVYPASTLVTLVKKPIGAGNYAAWSKNGGGTGTFAEVDDYPNNGDTDYIVDTAGGGNASTFTLESNATAGITGTVIAVRPFLIIRDVGTGGTRTRLRSGSTDSDTSSNTNQSATYGGNSNLFLTDPATASAWALASLNSVEVGVLNNVAVESRVTQLGLMVYHTPSVAMSAGVITKTGTTSTSASFTAVDASGGTGPYSYQWQRSTDFGLTWSDLGGKTSLTPMSDATPTVGNIYTYRLRYIDSAGSPATVYSNNITLATGPSANNNTIVSGWWVHTPSSTSRFVFLSAAAGNDGTASNNNPGLPYLTAAAAYAQMRDGQDDYLIILDVADYGLLSVTNSGASASARQVVRAAIERNIGRPILRVASSSAGGNSTSDDYLFFDGLDCSTASRNPHSASFSSVVSTNSGLNLNHFGASVLFQDCRIAWNVNNAIQGSGGTHDDHRLYRCNVLHNYRDPDTHGEGESHGQGLFSQSANTLNITQCYVDHNGWNETWASDANTTVANYTAVSNGQFSIIYDGTTYQVTGCDFTSGVTTMANVATKITARIVAAGAAVTAKWDASDTMMVYVGADDETFVTSIGAGSGGGTNINGASYLNGTGHHLAIATIFDRNFYIARTALDNVCTGNFILRSASEGFQFRAGGQIDFNVEWGNPIAGWAGPKSTTNRIDDNFVDMEQVTTNTLWDNRGWGLYFTYGDGDNAPDYTPNAASISRNIIVNRPSTIAGELFALNTRINTTVGAATASASLAYTMNANVVKDWHGPAIRIDNSGGTIAITGNKLQNAAETGENLIELPTTTTGITVNTNRFQGGDASPFKIGVTDHTLATFNTALAQTAGTFANLGLPTTTGLMDTLAVAMGFATFKAFRIEVKARAIRGWSTNYDATQWFNAAKTLFAGDQPTNLALGSPKSTTTITATWDAYVGSAQIDKSIVLQWATENTFASPTTVTGIAEDATSYLITGLPTPGATYYVRIKVADANNAALDSAYSSTASGSTSAAGGAGKLNAAFDLAWGF